MLLSFLLFILSLTSWGQFSDTLFIYKDSADIRGYQTTFAIFSSVDSFRIESYSTNVSVGETINLTIINRDTLPHTFTVDNIITTGNIINANDTVTFSFSFNLPGTHIFYSDVSYGKNLGASGQILVGYENYPHFYWNLFDQEVALSHDLALLNTSAIPSSYLPEVYTINFNSYPQTIADTNALVVGNVSDTLIISIINTGKMAHALHFHGYHVEILFHSKNNLMEGLLKDTFPLEVDAECIVRLIPHQSGMYPVHDHNLFAVNTGGYPGGMITMINISP